MDLTDRLIISYPLYFSNDTSGCGYCNGQKAIAENNYSLMSLMHKESNGITVNNSCVGFQSEQMSVEQYDRLCNMGYRRSGNFVYKGDMLRNCCRKYTIRTKMEYLKIDKELKKSLRRFNKFVNPTENEMHKKNKGNVEYNVIEEVLKIKRSSSRLKTVFEPSVYSQEKYELFCKFQENIHHDYKHSERGFRQFLCHSPFTDEEIMGTEEEWEQLNNWDTLQDNEYIKRLGPAHECYYLDGKLIAFAVTDFLVTGLSSVYFVWDPDYARLSLGKVSALKELVLSTKIKNGYYYLGYYIGDCPKMNYKGKYGGELLDLCAANYVRLEKLDNITKHGRLFIMTDSEDKCDTPQSEPYLNEKLKALWLPSLSGENLINIAENIYGSNGKALLDANKAAISLKAFGMDFRTENMNGDKLNDNNTSITTNRTGNEGKKSKKKTSDAIRSIPNVLPGLVPLPEVLEIINSGKIDTLKDKLLIFDTELGGLRPFMGSKLESPEVMKIICDTIRVMGTENAMNTIIII
ncbi:hypothetical protein TPHA_0F00570 [Tetrapisispora phaffii CBS 4417]|uniref:arginyltransferase n=1 Tax=Tetrapisispora phaffii (strain ATCC 24235 / CBS 4417 / NBRC 1672 / NRRL Y-8282 / UCD 70-5) TaxID=1071381 RepID=G8BUW2_TETPH|nr:hypothetical protein TPHA_0F00570 [Tetrapisispora phaffii CBS 4417]CCE63544.1 hypothetical protein TPHA_0F00570 [Tetrapisispora phaffii CBS 4417]